MDILKTWFLRNVQKFVKLLSCGKNYTAVPLCMRACMYLWSHLKHKSINAVKGHCREEKTRFICCTFFISFVLHCN